jgi:hypothetical protein
VHSGEATNTNFIVFGLIWSELEPTIYLTCNWYKFLKAIFIFYLFFRFVSLSLILPVSFWMHLVISFLIVTIWKKKYAPALDNYGQSCFVRSDFLKMKCVCKTQIMPQPDHQNPVDMHTSITCINILQNIKAVALKL